MTRGYTALERAGHAFFAVTLIGLGALGFATHDFTPIWMGVRKSLSIREWLVYACATVSLVCGVGLLVRLTSAIAARVLLGYIVIWWLVFLAPLVARTPTASGNWWACGATAVMMGAAWARYAALASGPGTGKMGIRIAQVLFGLGVIPFGIAHFTFLERTVSMVPSWLPWHLGWAYVTGAAFIAAGVASALGIKPRLAAYLLALEMGLFTLIVWVPVVTAHPTASDWAEFVQSWALTAAAWAVAAA
jgi:uncharacterized membrane protein